MNIRDLYRTWARTIASLRGKTLATGGVSSDSLPLLSPRRQGRAKSIGHADPIMLMDAYRDADIRLQQKFEEIKREEVNILDKLIPMD